MLIDQPLVTVYIPTFNRVELLKRAVESVRCQTYDNLDIIIVDDCSTDGTQEYLKSIATEDNRIRYFFKEKNSGACVSRNIAIENARGEFITGLDDDDYFTNQRVEIFLKNWVEDPLIKALSARTAIKKNDKIIYNYHRIITGRNKVYAKDLLKNNYVGNQIFTKTEIIKNIGGFDANFRMWQDLECWYNLIKDGGYIKKVHKYTYVQDISHEYSRITNSNKSKLNETFNKFVTKHSLEGKEETYLKSHFFNYGFNEVSSITYLLKFLDGLHLIDLIRFLKIFMRKIK